MAPNATATKRFMQEDSLEVVDVAVEHNGRPRPLSKTQMPSPTARVPQGPHPVWPVRVTWPLHDAAATREAEQAAAAQLPPHTLMARAGLAVARVALALAPHARDVEIWCGPGNNGGDGFVAARWLHLWGKSVRVIAPGDAARAPPDAQHALQAARDAGVPVQSTLPERVQAELAIDALFGIGGARELSGLWLDAVLRLNAAAALVLAVDVPTGLQGDTGAVLGQAVRAAHTLSLLTLKPGLFTAHGRDHAGRVWFDDLGVAAPPVSLRLSGPEAATELSAPRAHVQHKGSFGDVVVIGGAAGMTGAAVLAARAALAAGAGRVYLGLLGARDAPAFDATQPELMSRAMAHLLEPKVLTASTVVCGCGGGADIRGTLPPVLHHARRLVLDADALNTIAAEPALQRALRARAERQLETVLTPHPLEAARLLQQTTAQVQADRVRAARALAAAMQCTVLLKGSGSVVADREQDASINATGDARLGTAGSGDVLAGWLGGWWGGASDGSGQRVTEATAWLHGAATEQGPHIGPLRASELVGAMQRARDLLGESAH
jgi:hydroxyethylthiazole kinase-like uncharacterized protein yjeF